MRKKIVAGNWKMNQSFSGALELVSEIKKIACNSSAELIIVPPYLYVGPVIEDLKDTTIKVGAQNCSDQNNGAYTGEISAEMLQEIKADYVIIGHSERRTYFKETNKLLAKKIDQVLDNKLFPIYCCGEHLEEREKGKHFDVVKTQISEGIFHLTNYQMQDTIIAYEPVWAIGTGVTASSEQAQEMHAFIRKLLIEKYGIEIANSISILYGGSCKPSNSKELFAQEDIDGGLIGGASLNANDFVAIANSF